MPADWEIRLRDVKEKLLKNKQSVPGDADLLSGLLHVTLEISLNWLGSQNISFDVVYDPRQKKEDRFLLRYAAEWLTDEKYAYKRFPGIYQGATAKMASSQSPGLMLADLVVRDLRFLFSDLPGLITEGSKKSLILSISQDAEPFFMSIGGLRMKCGHRRPMSPMLRGALRNPTANSMTPLYLDRLAVLQRGVGRIADG